MASMLGGEGSARATSMWSTVEMREELIAAVDQEAAPRPEEEETLQDAPFDLVPDVPGAPAGLLSRHVTLRAAVALAAASAALLVVAALLPGVGPAGSAATSSLRSPSAPPDPASESVAPMVTNYDPAEQIEDDVYPRVLVDQDAGPVPFDCDLDFADMRKGWSVWKKRWCCAKQQIGCSTAITGVFHVCNLDYSKVTSDVALHRDIDSSIQTAVFLAATGSKDTPVKPTHPTLPESNAYNTVRVSVEEWASVVGNLVVHFEIDPPKVAEAIVRNNLSPSNLADYVIEHLQTVAGIDRVSKQPMYLCHASIDASTKRQICHCFNGMPAVDTACPPEGGHVCASCNTGYQKVDAQCVANTCECENGEAAEGSACVLNNAHICAQCTQGFHITTDAFSHEVKCQENICTCKDGDPAIGPACTSDNANICSSCGSSFHVDPLDHICKPNVCWCKNGKDPEPGDPSCLKHDSEVCASCDEFWHVDEDTKACMENVCTCNSGKAAVGEYCPLHGEMKCVDCNGDLQLHKDGSCGGIECTCLNGVPVEGAECTSHGGNRCKACNPGFHMVQEQCVRDICLCENGVPKQDDSCEFESEEICESCNDGYHFDAGGKKCVANECICDSGTAAVGKLCLQTGLHVCASCNPGYHPEMRNDLDTKRLMVLCAENKCTCEDGVAATLTSATVCHTDGGNVCQTCEAGFTLDSHDHSCKETECSCANGHAKMGRDCIKQGAEDCAACDLGFHLTDFDAQIQGTHWCRIDSATSPKPFDCEAGYTNRYLGWSKVKKHWCCQHEHKGCGLTATARESCENNQLDARQCSMVGCCEYNPVVGCITKTGMDPNAYCHGGAQITWHLSKEKMKSNKDVEPICLQAIEPHRDNGRVGADICNPHESKMSWTFNEVTGQIRNAYGKCIAVSETFGIIMTECHGEAVYSDQKWTAERDGLQAPMSRLKNVKDGKCLALMQKGDAAQETIFDGVTSEAMFEAIEKDLGVMSAACDSEPSTVWILSSGATGTWTTTATTSTITTTTLSTTTTWTTTSTPLATTVSTTEPPPGTTSSEAAATTGAEALPCETAVNGSACFENIKQVRELVIPSGLPPCPGLTIHSADSDIQNCLASRPDTACKKRACSN